jgi:hypothetical protein
VLLRAVVAEWTKQKGVAEGQAGSSKWKGSNAVLELEKVRP